MLIKKENLGKVSVTVEKDYWLQDKCYDRLVIVQQERGGTYISRKPVPSGKELTDRNYWIPIIEGSSSNNNSPAPDNHNTLKGRTAKGAYIDGMLLFSIIDEHLIDEMLPLMALQIDSIKDDIELDEITPKILTERDDYGINATAFAMAYSMLNGSSGGSGGSMDPGGIKKNTKNADSNSSTFFEHNAVVIKQDNDVLRCIAQHKDLFEAYLYAILSLGDSQGNRDYPEQYAGAEPIGVHPYHDMSGIYVSANGDIDFNESDNGRNVDAYNSLNNRSETKIKTSSTKHNVAIPTLEDFNDFKNNIKSKLISRFSTQTNTKKIGIDIDDDNDDFDPGIDPGIDSSEVTELVNSLLNGYTPKTQVAINDFSFLELSEQTVNIKKYMIGFYKIMKLIENLGTIYDEEDFVSDVIADVIADGFSDNLRYLYENVITGAESFEEEDEMWDRLSNYNQREGFMHVTKERRQAIYKEITDAIYDFDVLLGNNMNIPYEDTISMFIKFQNVWYEIIVSMEAGSVFEPNKEFKLVHLGDWKHVGVYNNQVLGYIASEFGDPNEPIDRDSSDYMGDGLNITGPGGNSSQILNSNLSKTSKLK